MSGSPTVPSGAVSHSTCTFTVEGPNTAYLQLQFEDVVAGKNSPFPDGTAVLVYYVNESGKTKAHSGNPVFTSGKKGQIKFTLEEQVDLYFEIAFKEPTYINLGKGALVTKAALDAEMGKGTFDTTKDLAFLLPRKMSLKDTWWDLGAVPPSDGPKYDTSARRFREVKTHRLVGATGYLEMTLRAEWQYLAFEYPDRPTKSCKRVPQGLLVAGYNLALDEDNLPVISNLYRNNCVCVPWILDRNKSPYRKAEKIVYEFFTKDLWVESGSKLVSEPRASIQSKSVKERLKYFDLPQRWNSRNWKGRLGASASVTPIKEAVNQSTTLTSPLVIELDSVALADEHCHAESWDGRDQCTVFDRCLKVTNPRTNEPYLTLGSLDSNFIPHEMLGYDPRVVAADGVFFDITDKRTIDGDVIGARAAVRNDPAVHAGQALQGPIYSYVGNFELHCFTECLDSTGAEVFALLVYWSSRFEKDSAVSAVHFERFHQVGMIKAKERWEQKEYRFIPRDPSKKTEIIPVYFFEGRRHTPYKCTVYIHPLGGRANMGLTEGNFKVGKLASGADSDYEPHGSLVYEDSKQYAWFTMAHELGHATGLHDEYQESLGEDSKESGVPDWEVWKPALPQFTQYYTGMPYSLDDASIMVQNKAPRLRHFWFFCRWLNETEAVKKLTHNTPFQVHSQAGGLNYFLEEAYKNIYAPAIEEKEATNGPHGLFDLALYRIGNDETRALLKVGTTEPDAILVVRHRLQWFFEDQETEKWANVPYKLRFLRSFKNKVTLELRRVMLSCSGASLFRNIYVYFDPHFYFEGTTIKDHFEITVKANSTPNVKYTPDFYREGYNKDEFTVDEKEDLISIYRYVLGLEAWKLQTSTTGGARVSNKVSVKTIDKNDLKFLGQWVARKAGGGMTYSVTKL